MPPPLHIPWVRKPYPRGPPRPSRWQPHRPRVAWTNRWKKKKQAEAADAAKKKDAEAKQAAQKADNCKRAQEAKATLDSGMRIARLNANGEREVLDDQARAVEMKRAQDIISADCK